MKARRLPEPFLGSLALPVDVTSSFGLRRLQHPVGAARRETQRALLAQMADAEQRIPGLLSEISALAASADPLALYSQIQVLAAIRRAMLSAGAGFGIDALVEFYGGLVTALPEQDVLDRLGTEFRPWTLYELEGLLREYGKAENFLQQGRMIREGGRDSLTRVRHLLEFEHRFDRMMGYPAQLRQIFHAVVDPLAERSIKQLGYALGDVLTAADAYQSTLVRRGDAVLEEAGVAGEMLPDDPEERLPLRLMYDAYTATFAAAPLEDDLPGLLAERTGIPRERLAAALAALVTPLGSQPGLSTLGATNRLRRRPIIGLPDGRYLWPRPGDFVHEALDWAAEVCQADAGLIKAFDKRRQDGCEELTRRALSDVFGTDYVHADYTYAAPGRPDIDVLVATPGVTVVVEVKGGRLTDPARRAAPDRIRKKTGEFVDKALSQNARTITHLQAGAAGLQDAKGRAVAIPNAPDPTSMIVTLDRVDPFATHLPTGGKRTEEPAAGTWLVALADLMMATDILRHPAEFYAYVQTRAAINKAGSPLIFVETDALGAWCEHRIKPDSAEPGQTQVLGTSSEIMNGYYTHVDDDVERPARPCAEVPSEVLNALDEVLRTRPEYWRSLALATLSVRPKDWREVRRALARHGARQSAGSTKRRDRKRVRRTARGFTVSPCLTVYFATGAPLPEVDATTLVVRQPAVAEAKSR
ncbi:hypothetical protein [Micromonospora sp. NPDC048843]|uniref:hypothetical protein n=1 Tax=Micromonospora sp. NPDC048843 TaxID=3155389 RepID=UPI0033CA5926